MEYPVPVDGAGTRFHSRSAEAHDPMPASIPFHSPTRHPAMRAASVIALLALLSACDVRTPLAALPSTQPAESPEATTSDQRAMTAQERKRDADARPVIDADMLDAYVRGVDEEIALMRATGRHFVSLSKYDEQGLQVAAKAGLSVRDYSDLKRAMHKVLYELMLHERFAGPARQARLAGMEPHKREHAEEVLARDPYASVSTAERNLIQTRLVALRSQYDGYMDLAAIAD